MTALYTISIATLSQLLSASYNFQYLNALGINSRIHPLTIEDNIQTALTQLPNYILSILLPMLFGFAVGSISPNIFQKNTKQPIENIVGYLLPICVIILAQIISASFLFNFFPNRIAALAHLTFSFALILIVFLKIELVFSLSENKNKIIYACFYIAFLISLNLLHGEIDGQSDREERNINYVVKIKNEKEEYHACTAIRVYANDILLVRDGIVKFIKKDSVTEISVIK
jgi:hypothetical protein